MAGHNSLHASRHSVVLVISDTLNKPANRQLTANKTLLPHALTRQANSTMTKHPEHTLQAIPEVTDTIAKPVMTTRRIASDEQGRYPIARLQKLNKSTNDQLTINKTLLPHAFTRSANSTTKSKLFMTTHRSARPHQIHHKRQDPDGTQ